MVTSSRSSASPCSSPTYSPRFAEREIRSISPSSTSGFSAVIQTGLLLLAYGAGATVALRLGGRITDRVGGGISSALGLVITIGATLPFVFLPTTENLVVVELLQALRGIGVGLAGIPAMSAAFNDPHRRSNRSAALSSRPYHYTAISPDP
ncbi:MFS transporter [Subtercola lobariae]|uniref:MFS transporter n=1 Tax=Subtercola lobariae TaxID=1588641 RepID=UPI0016651FDD